MYWLALLIPLAITFGFYLYKKHEFTWWEFFIPIASVAIVIAITKVCVESAKVSYSEYWGSTVVAVYEKEPWNEWVHKTCQDCTTDSDGKEHCTDYDCSYQDDHAPSWWAITNLNEEFSITEKEHDELVRQFNTKKTVIDKVENYDSDDRCTGSDGTKFQGKEVGEYSYTYETKWNKQENTRKAYASLHSYVNKVKASDLTIFNIKMVSEADADSLKLFKYPDCKNGGWFSNTNGLEYPTILGGSVSKNTQENFKRLNGKFGVSNHLRLWILVYENKPMDIALKQENYWVRGNKNELVLCIGKKGNEILWSYAFSWSPTAILTAEVKDYVMGMYQYKDTVIKKMIPPVLSIVNDNNKGFKTIKNKINKGKLSKLNKVDNFKPKNDTTYVDTTIKVKSLNYPVLTEKTWNDLYLFLDKNLNRFEKRSFKQFDYLTVEPSRGAMWFIFIFAIIISIGINIWIISNEYSSDDDNNDTSYNRWRY
jgi:hypothetical protein